MAHKIGTLEDAPHWYGTPFDKLEFEWSREEKLELKRYCEKILENASQEEMSPKQRFEATFAGKEKDRLWINTNYGHPFAARTLDGWADAIKPGDLYANPKLIVKSQLAMAARYKMDSIDVYAVSYNETTWGGNARMMPYATPMMLGKPPINTLEDMKDIEVPDPKNHGLYQGYLWAIREIKRVLIEHGADKVIPLVCCYCPGPVGAVMMLGTMMSMPAFMKSLRKEPEVAKRALELTMEWSIKFGKSVKGLEPGPDAIYLCDISGSFPTEFDWIIDYTTKIGKAVQGDNPIPMWHELGTMSTGWLEWMPLYWKRGALGKDTFWGWYIDPVNPYEDVLAFSREHDIYCCVLVNEQDIIKGGPELEEKIKLRAEGAKLHPKHSIGFPNIDYWTRPEQYENAYELARKYGKF